MSTDEEPLCPAVFRITIATSGKPSQYVDDGSMHRHYPGLLKLCLPYEKQTRLEVDVSEDLEDDLRFNRLAHEVWAGKPGRAEELAAAIANLQAERERHLEALVKIGKSFAKPGGENIHGHLDVPDHAYVRSHLFPDPPHS